MQELAVILIRAKSHHPLHARAVVPGAIEERHLARCGQVRRVALEIPLRLLTLGGRGQRHDAADARAQALRDALDDAALAGRVSPLEDDDDFKALLPYPLLELYEFYLEPREFGLIHPFGQLLARGFPGVSPPGVGGGALVCVRGSPVVGPGFVCSAHAGSVLCCVVGRLDYERLAMKPRKH